MNGPGIAAADVFSRTAVGAPSAFWSHELPRLVSQHAQQGCRYPRHYATSSAANTGCSCRNTNRETWAAWVWPRPQATSAARSALFGDRSCSTHGVVGIIGHWGSWGSLWTKLWVAVCKACQPKLKSHLHQSCRCLAQLGGSACCSFGFLVAC